MGAGENVSAPSGQRVAVIGSGYVGTVMAACLAPPGVGTTAVEAAPRKLARLVQS
jgi:UDP-glucose 6-dehydrogenase